MSDMREAFEALDSLFKSSSLPDRAARYNQVKAALQSQTAPAVPDWDADASNILEQARQLQEAQYGPSAQTFTAAPQPDDRKVEPPTWTAEEEPVAYLTWHQVRHAIDDWEEVVVLSHKSDKSADGTPAFPVYTHPTPQTVQSENEVKAQALEAYARDLDQVHKSAKRQHAYNTPAWYAGSFAKDARAAAARLRGDKGA